MSLFRRNAIITAKIESSYGTDSSPTATANAIQVTNLNPQPQDADMIDLALIRPYMGNSPQIPAAIRGMLDFECFLQGSGTAGTAPAYGPLLRACGFAETILAAPVTGTASAGGVATLTLTGASAVDNAYKGMVVRITGGTGSGTENIVASYVGSTKVATFIKNWSVTPDNTSAFSVDAQVIYLPISSGFESVSTYLNMNGVRHKFFGARGTVATVIKAKDVPRLQFKFTGIYVDPADAAEAAAVYTAWKQPVGANSTNTPSVNFLGVSPVLSDITFDMQNQVVHRALIGSELVLITDRKAGGQMNFEATLVATKDWWTAGKNATNGALDVTHGLTAGNKVTVYSPFAQLVKPTYGDQDGVAMLSANASFIPSSSGNDEVGIIVR